jgi:nucleotide-binding universal stress UspA family protein
VRILCCLDGTNIEELHHAVTDMLTPSEQTVGLLYVIDSGPRKDIERTRERFLHPPHLPSPRAEQVSQAEVDAAQDILREGQLYFHQPDNHVDILQRTGRPEHEIVQCSRDWQADLIIICPRAPRYTGPPLGPRSVGHVARFVLDHAPCPVLLVRPLNREAQLPLPPGKSGPLPPPPGKHK